MVKECKTCDKPLAATTKGDYCLKHINGSPEKRAKLSAALKRAHMCDPQLRVKARERQLKRVKLPGVKAAMAESCKRRRLWELGNAARTPEINKRHGKTWSERYGYASWCPPELIETAKWLRKMQRLSLGEVKVMIAEQHERDMARFRKGLDQ